MVTRNFFGSRASDNATSGVLSRVAGADGPALVIQQTGTDSNIDYAVRLFDDAANMGRLLHVEHHGTSQQANAVDISNRSGAWTGFALHQYSDAATAAQIDNTRAKPFLTLKNTENPTLSPGTFGTGDFLDLWGGVSGAVERFGTLDKDLTFRTKKVGKAWRFTSDVVAPSLEVTQANAANAFTVTQNGAQVAFTVAAGSGAAGFYLANFTGQNYGPQITTATNSGDTLTLTKNGTGAGRALVVTNKGTGLSVDVRNASASVFSVSSAGVPEVHTAGEGIVLKSPDGTRYKVTVANGGALAVAAA